MKYYKCKDVYYSANEKGESIAVRETPILIKCLATLPVQIEEISKSEFLSVWIEINQQIMQELNI